MKHKASEIIGKSRKVVKCDTSRSRLHFASYDIVPPYAVLVLNEDSRENILLKRSKTSIYIEIDNEKVRLRLPVFLTSSQEVYNNEEIYRVLALLGVLHKHVFSIRVNTPKYIWEQMVVYDKEDFSLLLESVPREIRATFKSTLWENTCFPKDESYSNKVLVSPFFPIKYGSNEKELLGELEDWMFYSSSKFLRSSRIRRYFKLIRGIIRGKNEFEEISLAVNILKRTLRLARLMVTYGHDISNLFEATLTYLSLPSSIANEFRKSIAMDYIVIRDELSLAEKYLDFFEYSLLSVDETLNRVIELTRNDLLSLIEVTMFLLTIPSVLQLILSVL